MINLPLNKVVKIEPAEYENSLCGENTPDLANVGDLSNIVDLGGAGNPFPVSESE